MEICTSGSDAEARRGFDPDAAPEDGARPASLYFRRPTPLPGRRVQPAYKRPPKAQWSESFKDRPRHRRQSRLSSAIHATVRAKFSTQKTPANAIWQLIDYGDVARPVAMRANVIRGNGGVDGRNGRLHASVKTLSS